MRIILDGLAYEKISLEAALEIVEDFIKKQAKENRVIKSCRLNDMEIEGDFIQAIKDNLGSINILELSSQAIAELVFETAMTAQNYIENLISNIENIAGEIALGKEVNSDIWKAILEGLTWLVDVCRGILSQKETPHSIAKAMMEQVTQLGNLMVEVQKAYAAQDNITVADLLEYELVELLENMQQTLKDFRFCREV